MRRTRQHAYAQTSTTCDGVSFKANLRRTVASYSQRQIFRQRSISPFAPCRSATPRVQVSSLFPLPVVSPTSVVGAVRIVGSLSCFNLPARHLSSPRPRPCFTPRRSSARTPASSGSSHLTCTPLRLSRQPSARWQQTAVALFLQPPSTLPASSRRPSWLSSKR